MILLYSSIYIFHLLYCATFSVSLMKQINKNILNALAYILKKKIGKFDACRIVIIKLCSRTWRPRQVISSIFVFIYAVDKRDARRSWRWGGPNDIEKERMEKKGIWISLSLFFLSWSWLYTPAGRTGIYPRTVMLVISPPNVTLRDLSNPGAARVRLYSPFFSPYHSFFLIHRRRITIMHCMSIYVCTYIYIKYYSI